MGDNNVIESKGKLYSEFYCEKWLPPFSVWCPGKLPVAKWKEAMVESGLKQLGDQFFSFKEPNNVFNTHSHLAELKIQLCTFKLGLD